MLDLILLVLIVGAGFGGYRLGFVTRAASWAGLLVGVFLAAQLMPRVIEAVGEDADRTGIALLAIGLLIGGAAIGQAIGLLVGGRARLGIATEGGRRIDHAAGALAGVVGTLVIVWLLVPAGADMAGWQAREVRRSRIVAALDRALPTAPDATRTLRRLLGDGYPQVFEGLDRSPEVGPVPEGSGLTQAQAEAAAASVVRVTGAACGGIQEGTGWVVADGLIVTNAHVVAGEDETQVVRPDGATLDAVLVAFDPEIDLAVLSVLGLGMPALEVGESEVGVRGAVFGHPGGGPLEVSPFEVRRRLDAVGTDIYGATGQRRDVLVLASDLAPGDSGSPLVSTDGIVVGVAFAIAPDRDGVAYALSTDELREVLDSVGDVALDAGPCAA